MNLLDNRNITCVEYYLLHKLNYQLDIRKLYYKSFIPAYKIYLDLLEKDIHFTSYDGIVKIQNILMENKMLTYKVTSTLNEANLKNKSLIHLILVNKNFFEDKKKTTFRKDHYIQVEMHHDKLLMINSYPVLKEEIDMNQLKVYFDNKCLVYKLLKKDRLTFSKVKAEFIKHLRSIDFLRLPETLEIHKFQSLIQLLKITRLRLYDLCCYLKVEKSLINQINEINKYYENIFLKISMMIIKKKIDSMELKEIIFKINKYENELDEKLRKEFLNEK